MDIIHRYWIPILILAAGAGIAYFLPEDKRVQIIAPLVVGAVMFSLNSLLGKPDVVIEECGKQVSFSLDKGVLVCWISGRMVNRSATGIGELKYVQLHIQAPARTLEAYLEHPVDVDTNYRFLSHGVYPSGTLSFRLQTGDPTLTEVSESPAYIVLSVSGQNVRTYKVKMAKGVQGKA